MICVPGEIAAHTATGLMGSNVVVLWSDFEGSGAALFAFERIPGIDQMSGALICPKYPDAEARRAGCFLPE